MGDNGAMIVRGMQIGTCFIENGTTELNIMCMLIGIGSVSKNLFVVNEFISAQRLRVIGKKMPCYSLSLGSPRSIAR